MELTECIQVNEAVVTFSSHDQSVNALNGISLSAKRGELLALMGPSGSGKSTLLNVMAGLQVVSNGEVFVDGRDLQGISEKERTKLRLSEIGVIFQDNNLIPEFTVEENILLPLRARGFSKSAAQLEIQRCLAAVDLMGFESRRPSSLSGGQQQRAGIARALAGERQFLLADEPTGALDSVNTDKIFSLLRDLAASGNCVVVATHDPEIKTYADRIIWIRDGNIENQWIHEDSEVTN